MKLAKRMKSASAPMLAVALGACSGGSDNPTGTVSVSLMDRPVDGVTALYVTITEVWLKPAGAGPAFQLPMTTTPLTINLLELDDENAAVLIDEAVVAAGSYNWVELEIDDSAIEHSYAMTTTGGMVPVDVDVPSGSIRLVSGFEVGANQALRLLFDWDVRKGLTETASDGSLTLRPAFRILDVDELGVVSGSITADTVALEGSCAAVAGPDSGTVIYVFEGSVTPDEIDGTAPEPIATAQAEFNTSTADYDYRVVLMPGDYTLAATCEGDLDTDAPGDGITLFPAEGVAVAVAANIPVEDVDF